MPAAADELEVAEQVEEEAGLIGHQQVEQNIMLKVHCLQENQEGGVRVDAGMQFWLLSGEEGFMLALQTLLKLCYRHQVHVSYFHENGVISLLKQGYQCPFFCIQKQHQLPYIVLAGLPCMSAQ